MCSVCIQQKYKYKIHWTTTQTIVRKKRKISLEKKIFLLYLDIIALAYYRGSVRGFSLVPLFYVSFLMCVWEFLTWMMTINSYLLLFHNHANKSIQNVCFFKKFGFKTIHMKRVYEEIYQNKKNSHTKPILLRPRNGPRGRPQ